MYLANDVLCLLEIPGVFVRVVYDEVIVVLNAVFFAEFERRDIVDDAGPFVHLFQVMGAEGFDACLDDDESCFFHQHVILAGELASARLDDKGKIASKLYQLFEERPVVLPWEGVSDELEIESLILVREDLDFLDDSFH